MADQDTKQAKGGRARAQSLTAQQKSEIAKKAAGARWEWPVAEHEGELRIGNVVLECAVLKDGTAVISETQLMKQMGIYRSGALSSRREADETGARAPLHLAFKNLQPYVEHHFGEDGLVPLKYRTKSGSIAHGIKAEDLPKLCEVWLDARKAEVLGPRQEQVAEVADILIRGFAHVGIVALVHEATGYQYERQRDALQEMLQEFLSDKLRKWVKTFPNAYFTELCRLRGVTYRPDMKLPSYFGHLTNDIIYKRLAPSLLEKLQERNPTDEKGRRKVKNFQNLSEAVGVPKLHQHMGLTIGLMKISPDYEVFEKHLDKIAPRLDDMPLFEALPTGKD